ncbi:MAG: DUF4974 domain-containing protein [Flavobacteriaceae bacterium]
MDNKLLFKYIQGFTSEEENAKIEDWILHSEENAKRYNRIKTNFALDSFAHTREELSIDRAYEVFRNKHIRPKVPHFKKTKNVWRYAAIIVFLLATTVFIYNGQQAGDMAVPNNAIILKRANGSIEIVQENGSFNVLDSSGKIVGKQNGHSLVYVKDSTKTILEYNTLAVPNGKTFELTLSDGTYVHLNSGSSLTYPVQFLKETDRQVYVKGEAFFKVAKDTLLSFIVNADELNVQVLGTQFNVQAYQEDEVTEIVLVEGSVSLFTDKNGNDPLINTLLRPGSKASFNKMEEGITTLSVDTDIYTSWRKGELAFRNMTMENILKKLERHYNVIIVNTNSAISKERFNANFGNEPILDNVLEDLKRNYGIDYKIEADIITIY